MSYQTLKYGNLVGIFTNNEKARFDIGGRATNKEQPASHNSTTGTRLRIERVDGSSSGDVKMNHVVRIVTEAKTYTLDLSSAAMKEAVPVTHNSWATKFKIWPANSVGSKKGKPVRYGDVISIYNSHVGGDNGPAKFVADLGTGALTRPSPYSRKTWGTTLRIRGVDPVKKLSVSKLVFDTHKAKVVSTGTDVVSLGTWQIRNGSKTDQAFEMKKNFSFTGEQIFQVDHDAYDDVPFTGSAGMPYFTPDGKVKVGASTSFTHFLNKTVTKKSNLSVNATPVVPAKSVLTVTAQHSIAKVSVPFHLYTTAQKLSGGTYTWNQSADFIFEVSKDFDYFYQLEGPVTLYDAPVILPGRTLKQVKESDISGNIKKDLGNHTRNGSILVCVPQLGTKMPFLRKKMLLQAEYHVKVAMRKAEEEPRFEEIDEKYYEEEDNDVDVEMYDSDGEDGDEELKKLHDDLESPRKEVFQVLEQFQIWNNWTCFRLNTSDDMKSNKELIDSIELSLYLTDLGIGFEEANDKIVEYGESFVIDLTDKSTNPLEKGYLFLDWDDNNTLMRPSLSPDEIAIIKSESTIPQDLLYLGMKGRKDFDPSKPLVVNVHLPDVFRNPQGLQLKLYRDAEIETDFKKSYDDMVESLFHEIANGEGDSILLGKSSFSGVDGKYVKFEIDPKSLVWEGVDSNDDTADEKHMVWGVNSKDEIYCRKEDDQNWTKVSGGLKQISVAYSKDGEYIVWGVNSNDDIYYRKEGDQNWTKVSGGLKCVSVGYNPLDGKYMVWGVNSNDNIYYRKEGDQNWTKVSGGLKQISVDYSRDGKYMVWGVNSNDSIYCRREGDSSWTKVSGGLKCASVGAYNSPIFPSKVQREGCDKFESGLDQGVQFAAVIEYRTTEGLKTVAKFLLPSIGSNDLYFDSATQMLKANSDSGSLNEVSLTNWSNMVMRASRSDWDSIYPEVAYKKTKIKSKPLMSGNDDKNLQKFQVTVEMPNINIEVLPMVNNNAAAIDPKHFSLLVENCDPNLVFAGKQSRFHHIPVASKISVSEQFSSMEFDWSCIDKTVTNERNAEMKLSVLVEAEGEEPRKMGKTVSIIRSVGGSSKQHFSKIKLRNAIKMALVKIPDLDHHVTEFLESAFEMAFIFSTNGKESDTSRSLFEMAVDDISEKIYEAVLVGSDITIYDTILESEVFASHSRSLEKTMAIKDSDIAETVEQIFGWFTDVHRESLVDWVESILDDEDALELVGEGENAVDILQTFLNNIRRVFKMKQGELALQLKKHPEIKTNYVVAGQALYEELIKVLRKTADYVQPPAPDINRDAFDDLIDNQTPILDGRADEVMDEFDKNVNDLKDAIEVDPEKVKQMEGNLLTILRDATENCDDATGLIEESQVMLGSVYELLEKLGGLEENILSLSNAGRKLEAFVRRFWTSCTFLKRVAIGPLTPIKGIVTFMEIPMKTLKKFLKQGVKKIDDFGRKINKKLKKLLDKGNKLDKISDGADNSSLAIGKFSRIIGMVIAAASLGVIPVAVLTQLSQAKSINIFFDTLKNNFKGVKQSIEALLSNTATLQNSMGKVKSFLNDVQRKFNILNPFDRILTKLEPYVNKIKRIFDKYAGRWLKRLLKVAMWPVEQAINLLLSPFRKQINSALNRINPFRALDGLLAPLMRPLDNLPLDFEKFNALATLSLPQPVQDSFTMCTAVILRGLYQLLSGMLMQGVQSIEIFENQIGSVAFGALQEYTQELARLTPGISVVEGIHHMKMKSIDAPLAKCDSFLQKMSGKDTWTDPFTKNVNSYVNDASFTRHELAPCIVDPASDQEVALFEYGTADNSWLMSSITVLLHHRKITKQAVNIKALDRWYQIPNYFVPKDSGGGKFEVSLYRTIPSSNIVRSPEKIYVDTRLPVIKPQRLALGSDITRLPQAIFENSLQTVLAEVSPVFSEKNSWALIQKIVGCNFEVKSNQKENVGTGMHLLSGHRSGCCYKKENSTWKKYNGDGADDSGKLHRVKLQETGETITETDLINNMKNRILSIDEVDLLHTLQDFTGEDTSLKVESLRTPLSNLSMYIIVRQNVAHAILYKDNTEGNPIVYADGTLIQPLLEFSGVSEVWEFPVDSVPKPMFSEPRVRRLDANISLKKASGDDSMNIMSSIDEKLDDRVSLLQDFSQINSNTAEGLMMKAIQKNMMEMMKSGKVPEGMDELMGGMGDIDGMELPENIKEILRSLKNLTDSESIPEEVLMLLRAEFEKAFGSSIDGMDIDAMPIDAMPIETMPIETMPIETKETNDSTNKRAISDDENTSRKKQCISFGSVAVRALAMQRVAMRSLPQSTLSEARSQATASASSGIQATTSSASFGIQAAALSTSSVASFASSGIQATALSTSSGIRATTSSASSGIRATTSSASSGIRATTSSASSGIRATTSSESSGTDFDASLRRAISHTGDARLKNVLGEIVALPVDLLKKSEDKVIRKGDYIVRYQKNRKEKDKQIGPFESIYKVMNFEWSEKEVMVGKGSKKKKTKVREIVGYYLNELSLLNTDKLKNVYAPLDKWYMAKLTAEQREHPILLQEAGIFSLEKKKREARKKMQWEKQYESEAQKHNQQKKVPLWGMPFGKFKEYVNHCKKNKVLWAKLCQNPDKAVDRTTAKGFVNVTDFNNAFIRPHTKGLGSGVALNLVDPNVPNATKTQVMISHAWREDILQVVEMMDKQIGKDIFVFADDTKTTQKRVQFSEKTIVWFCALSQYQPEDGVGPYEEQQLELDTFMTVTSSVCTMFVLQTHVCDPYSKLWCVTELITALGEQKEGRMKVVPLFSSKWLEKYVQTEKQVRPLTAKWETREIVFSVKNAESETEDVKRNVQVRIDDKSGYSGEVAMVKTGTNRTFRNLFLYSDSNAVKSYHLMEVDERVKDDEDKGVDNDQDPVGEQPRLRFNVQRGLTEFGLHSGRGRTKDKKEFKRIDTLGSPDYEDQEFGKWKEMQRNIVVFQRDAAIEEVERRERAKGTL